MTGRDTTTLGEVLAMLEAARDAGRDVGESIRILEELNTEDPRSEVIGLTSGPSAQAVLAAAEVPATRSRWAGTTRPPAITARRTRTAPACSRP
jgi:hypothetical protein